MDFYLYMGLEVILKVGLLIVPRTPRRGDCGTRLAPSTRNLDATGVVFPTLAYLVSYRWFSASAVCIPVPAYASHRDGRLLRRPC